MINPFDERRLSDPQGVIDDLLKQTSRQAGAIHKLTTENEKLKEEVEALKKMAVKQEQSEAPKQSRKKKTDGKAKEES